MKNAEIMLDAIGDIDESLIPELYEKDKKSSGMVFYLIGGLCAAAILVTAIAIPTFRKNAEALSLYASINETKISDVTSGTENRYECTLRGHGSRRNNGRGYIRVG